MPTNLSLILNLLFLAGVVATIVRVVRQRQGNKEQTAEKPEPKLGGTETSRSDDIISVRKIQVSGDHTPEMSCKPIKEPTATLKRAAAVSPSMATATVVNPDPVNDPIVIFLAAKKNRQFAGYELLQALLAAGLRYGDGSLFHRHQRENGQGTLMFSLAAATESGQFNLSRMGAFTCKGLCLFLEPSLNNSIDYERFTTMHETATQLAEELDAILLDEHHKIFNSGSIQHYEKRLGCTLCLEPVEA